MVGNRNISEHKLGQYRMEVMEILEKRSQTSLLIRRFKKATDMSIGVWQTIFTLCTYNIVLYFAKSPGSKFWPGIDAISPIRSILGTNDPKFSQLDLFTKFTYEKSGRSPFNHIVALFSKYTKIEVETTMSLMSSICSIILNPLLLVTFYICVRPKRKKISVFEMVIFLSILSSLSLVERFPIRVAGYGLDFAPWITPQNLAEIICAISFLLYLTLKESLTKIATFLFHVIALLIHPTSTILMTSVFVLILFSNTKSKELLTYLASTIVGLFILRKFFYAEPTLSALQTFELYAKWRHPWHMLPSFIVDHDRLSIIIQLTFFFTLIVLGIRRRCFRDVKILLLLAALITVCAASQFIFVELFPISEVILFGPSRIFSFTPFIMIALAMSMFIEQKSDSEIHSSVLKTSLFVRTIETFLVLISLTVISSQIQNQYKTFENSVNKTKQQLNLRSDETILIDPSIDTIGWREFMEVPIYFDSYFPFNLAAFSEYRKRWIEICGQHPMTSCEFTNYLNSSTNITKIMSSNELDILVVKADNVVIESYPEFRLLGKSNSYKSFKLVKPSS